MEAFVAPFIEFVLEYSYAAEFLILLACGLGLPVPEEVTLIAGGYLCWKLQRSLWLTILVCMTAILLGDWLMFLLGQRYGKWILRSRWFRRMLTRRKLARVTLYFRKFGVKTVFFARFFAGIRVPVYFMAGSLKMRSWKFLWLDFWGAVLSVPISIYAGKYFGKDIQHAIKVMKRVKLEIALAILAGLVVYVVYRYVRGRRLAQAPHAEAEKVFLKAEPVPEQAPPRPGA